MVTQQTEHPMNAHSADSLRALPAAALVKPPGTDEAACPLITSLRMPRWRQPRFSPGTLALTVSAGILLALFL